ncbi:MAG: cysteine desulfurase NifS [Thermoanaerobacteraceae bacterium]|uniref:cysteine desulfurase NifS n=1 Tax=Thermanaeromonas sp. C210 TaxID=2731925 RepID=UPI00155C49A2|nr:cysteine desulfurase NifS [Thermanaeromonas sp. C210]MBE3581178.1 cysteine desulfurase NifS [Thermoanaerobacteraceae bacterium]GFN23212.1 cysteine desulfurase IscS [Thermanaeromonas sp. C210]
MRRVYLDHSATTPVRPEVLEEMLPFLKEEFGNPSTIYGWGRQAKKALEEARARVAALIGAQPEEIIFTSGGTEADNMALIGAAYANQKKGKHIITSSIEHHAVLDTAQYLMRQGFKVTFLPVTPEGLVRVEDVLQAITDETILISIMHVNNEVGTIQPIREIGRVAREKGIIFHTDAVQSVGKIPVNVQDLNVDLLTASAHKIYGPKGVGCLYVRKGTRIQPLLHGGGQERKRRAGTENVPGIVGFGKAAELAGKELESEGRRLRALRDKLIDGVLASIEETRLNGDREQRSPINANFSFRYVEGESILLSLDMKGIAASSGSACTSGSLDPSHVLLAMGIPHEIAHGSVRMTLGRDNTEEDIDYVLEVLPEIIERLRSMSPLYNKGK